MNVQVPWWTVLVGYAFGWLMGRLDRETQNDSRRRINHENTNRPSGPPPLKLQRSRDDDRLDSAALHYGRVVDACGRTVGYIPRPHDRTPIPPPSDPQNNITKPKFPPPQKIREDFLP